NSTRSFSQRWRLQTRRDCRQ
ncbi:Bifunctional protein HldE, partial [Haemophilus influenzae]